MIHWILHIDQYNDFDVTVTSDTSKINVFKNFGRALPDAVLLKGAHSVPKLAMIKSK